MKNRETESLARAPVIQVLLLSAWIKVEKSEGGVRFGKIPPTLWAQNCFYIFYYTLNGTGALGISKAKRGSFIIIEKGQHKTGDKFQRVIISVILVLIV